MNILFKNKHATKLQAIRNFNSTTSLRKQNNRHCFCKTSDIIEQKDKNDDWF